MKPILFNTEMVKAILDGRKTVTRRVLAEKEILDKHWALDREPYKYKGEWVYDKQTEVDGSRTYTLKPKYQVGDILWVRETWCYGSDTAEILFGPEPRAYDILYKADYIDLDKDMVKWRPSIHMPKEAARIFLKVTDVKVERLQDITAGQLRQEGLASMAIHCGDMEIAMKEWELLWNSTIKKTDFDKYGWNTNPWVWVIEFEKIEGSEGNG